MKETDYMCGYVNVDDAKWIDRKKQKATTKNGKSQVLTKVMGSIT